MSHSMPSLQRPYVSSEMEARWDIEKHHLLAAPPARLLPASLRQRKAPPSLAPLPSEALDFLSKESLALVQSGGQPMGFPRASARGQPKVRASRGLEVGWGGWVGWVRMAGPGWDVRRIGGFVHASSMRAPVCQRSHRAFTHPRCPSPVR